MAAIALLLVANRPADSLVAQATDTLRGQEIDAVRFLGAMSIDPDILRNAIATRPTTCKNSLVALFCAIGDYGWAEIEQFLRDTAQVRQDAERLETVYEVWGYPDARVSGAVLPRSDGDVVVEFTIEEGEPLIVHSIEVRGLEPFSPPIRLPRPLPLDVGEPYALPRLESTQELIRERLAELGHPYAQVEVTGDVDEAARQATLVLTVLPGPTAVFGQVTVEPEPPLSEGTVRGRLAYEPGEPFRPSAIKRSERLLYDLPVVERASITVGGLTRGDTVLPTHAIVDARRLHGVQMEGTISSTECLELAGFWQHRYFLGGPRLLAIGGGVSNLFAAQSDGSFPCSGAGEDEFGEIDHNVQVEVWQPSLFGSHRNVLNASAFLRRESSPNTYIERGFGGRLAVSRELGGGFHARGTYTAERNELDASAIYFCGNYGVCSADGIAELSSERWLAPFELIGIWTSAELPGDVRRQDAGAGTEWQPKLVPDWRYGVRLALEGAAGATGSDYAYGRALGEATVTRLLGRRGELAARARGGGLRADDVIPPQVRLYSGGVSTVRGVAQNLLGPKVLVASRSNLPADVCSPNDTVCAGGTPIDPEDVTVRPTGGNRVVEANVEGRLWLTNSFQVAAFVDYGRVSRAGSGSLGGTLLGPDAEARLTPGVGIRMVTDIGPIRIDVGYDPDGGRVLPLVTDDGAGGVRHVGNVRFDPYRLGDPSFFRETWRRLQFHMSIGQAF